MVDRKRKSKVILKLTKQQLEMAEVEYWKRYNNKTITNAIYKTRTKAYLSWFKCFKE